MLEAAEPRRLPAPAEYELWWVDLRFRPSPKMQASLSATELNKAARFVFERDRCRYIAAHATLRQLLAKRAALAPQDLEFTEGKYGKPALRNGAPCSFNLSHSDDEALVLIAAGGEIGVDVEVLRPVPDAQALAQRNFSAEEAAALVHTASPLRDSAFLAGWTRKEACLKAIGSGLSIAPDSFTAGLAHEALRADIPTPHGVAEVAVQSFCHEQRLLVAWARVVTVRSV
jgi:4'-phosphopantetheinyl transferase